MGIVKTDEWLKKDFWNPSAICSRLGERFPENEPDNIYQLLLEHGMYKPSVHAKNQLDQLISMNIWDQTRAIFAKYKKNWRGPDVPVYIFPLFTGSLFTRRLDSKSGLAFHDKLFLFISPKITEQELESVFVHEYHHICRLKQLKKQDKRLTLLDSIIMEGLAEHAVEIELGVKNVATWTELYSDHQLEAHYDQFIKKSIHIPYDHEQHNNLLVGHSPYPRMLGYCTGYYLVKKKKPLSIKDSFSISAEVFLPDSEKPLPKK
jgi:uncharacterized protein YjaZ